MCESGASLAQRVVNRTGWGEAQALIVRREDLDLALRWPRVRREQETSVVERGVAGIVLRLRWYSARRSGRLPL
jgi:hypothetical protein